VTVTDIILRYRHAFASGLLVTMALAAIAWGVGLTLGTLFGASASRYRRWIGYPLRAMSFTLAAIPPIVLLYWAHYPLQSAIDVVINPFLTAASILSLVNVVVVAEIIRSALDGFRVEYKMAAQVNGMTRWETFRFVEFPLVARQVLPSILAAQVLILQSTLFASLISVEELFRVAQRINSAIYQPIQIYTALAGFFLVVCMPVYLLAYVLRRRFLRDISEK
jgi:polar amino acid transport system permease protein